MVGGLRLSSRRITRNNNCLFSRKKIFFDVLTWGFGDGGWGGSSIACGDG